ncbi:sterol desaturase family protein [Blastococcus sp. TF02A-26]|nr:sterol desaturase family protein [Blastococcus sp. TF02A-26]
MTEVDLILYAIPAFVLLMVVEAVVLTRELRQDAADDEAERRARVGYAPKDTLASLGMGLGSLVVPVAITTVLGLGGYVLLWNATPLDLGTGWVAWLVAIVGKDFLYYWYHRASHEIRFFWAAHVVHHSSEHYNLSTALRQTWTPLTEWPFGAVLILLGVNPVLYVMASSINLLHQFWIHTEAIDRLPRPFEFVFNTPSHHRVHHGRNPQYLDKNYGGILIVFDRLFGTFEPEVEPVRYGITKPVGSYNPLRIATAEYVAIVRDMRGDRRWAHRLARLVRGPGWTPSPAPAAVPATSSAG